MHMHVCEYTATATLHYHVQVQYECMYVCMYVCKAVSFDFIQDALLGPGEGKGSCLSSGSPELSKGMTKSSMFGRTSFFCGRREEDGGGGGWGGKKTNCKLVHTIHTYTYVHKL